MPVAYLTLPGLKASVHGERLEITPPPAEKDAPLPAKSSIPLLDLDQVVVDARAHLSSQSINRLLQAGIPVCFLAHGDSPSGLALPYNRQSAILAQQLDRCREDDFRLQRAKELLESKIRNMRRLLQRLSREGTDWRGTLAFLKSIRAQLAAAPSLETLRGVEGLAAARYFESYGQLFPDAFPFEKRSRRPPRNPPNSLLSFLYTLLCNEIVLEIRATGMEPGWGWLHEQEDGRPALALDLMEPFRAPVVDAVVLDLFNHQRLQEDDFETTDEGAVLLKRNSRRKVFVAWETRLEREFLYQKTQMRTTIRAQIRESVRQAKKSFRTGTPLEPFQMN